MSHSRNLLLRFIFLSLMIVPVYANDRNQPAPAHAKPPVPAVTNEYIHREFGDNCALLEGSMQYTGDLDGDGIDDLVVAARCKNPMADKDEYGFHVLDPYDTAFGYGNVKVTSTFITEEPERKGVVLLIVHGVGPQAWRSEQEKPKFLMINLPFRAMTVKRITLKKRTLLGVYMEEEGEGEHLSSVIFWDGKKYRYESLGSTME